jgi:hypothetical protein
LSIRPNATVAKALKEPPACTSAPTTS